MNERILEIDPLVVAEFAETFRHMREEYDLPDSSAPDDYVAEEFLDYLRSQNLYLLDLSRCDQQIRYHSNPHKGCILR
jgi:hypothetical protein